MTEVLKKLSPTAIAEYQRIPAGHSIDQVITFLEAAQLSFHEKTILLRTKIKQTVPTLTRTEALAGINALPGGGNMTMSEDGSFLYIRLTDHHGKVQNVALNRGGLSKRQKRANQALVGYYRSIQSCDGTMVNEAVLTEPAGGNSAWYNIEQLTPSLRAWRFQMAYFYSADMMRLRRNRNAISGEARRGQSRTVQRARKIATGARDVAKKTGAYAGVQLSSMEELQEQLQKAVGVKAARRAGFK